MLRKYCIKILTVFFVFLIFSCGQAGLLVQDQSQEDAVNIKTLNEGSIVTKNSQIPLSIENFDSTLSPDRLEIKLLSSEGEELGTETIEGEDLKNDSLPSITLPQLETDLYILRFTLYKDNEIITEKEVKIFYTNEIFNVLGITSYPPVITSNTKAVLYAHLDIPEESSSYLRWSMGKELIAEGYVSDGFDKILWNAPAEEGVYSIKVELFPVGPEEDITFNFSSPRMLTTKIFVTKKESYSKNEFSPDNEYYSVFHFRGDVEDTGMRKKTGATELVGNPELTVRGNLFGYYLNGTNGFHIPSIILPEKEGALGPFSLMMRLQIDGIQKNRSFFNVTSADNNFTFSLRTDQQGLPMVRITQEAQNIESYCAEYPDRVEELFNGDTHTLTLSVVPEEKTIQFLWFVDGLMVGSEEKPYAPKTFPQNGYSLIGGEEGFIGIIDEFGIYYRDVRKRSATRSDIYLQAMKARYGRELIYAEGFDGMYMPEDVLLTGEAEIGLGKIILNSKGAITLPTFRIGYEKLSFEIQFLREAAKQEAEIVIRFLDSKLKPIVLNLDGKVLLTDKEAKIKGADRGLFTFQLKNNENGTEISSFSDVVKISDIKSEELKIEIEIKSLTDDTILGIERILITSRSLQIAREGEQKAIASALSRSLSINSILETKL
ncbi:MAG: hypothetical protein DRP87_13835 [Spirochaetes bacterium]|nr:MAG: hypothetical protein DRP87_13835 [Spirochaetota bacterium]